MMKEARLLEFDFIRGLAIISVIIMHALPSCALEFSQASLHIGQAVPLFLFITLFLSFSGIRQRNQKGAYSFFSKKRVVRVLSDVVIPFFIVVVLQMAIRAIGSDKTLNISNIRGWGGVGPGSYYIWVYLQLWILIPFLYALFQVFGKYGYVLMIAVCVILNYSCIRLDIPDGLYAKLCIRYLFISVVAHMLLDINKFKPTIIYFLAFLSLIYHIGLRHLNLTPIALDYGWSSQQWPAYFWTLVVMMALLSLARKMSYNNKIMSFFVWAGKRSWYIFITQMLIMTYLRIETLGCITNVVLRHLCLLVIVMLLSFVPALIFSIYERKSHAN